MKPLLETNLLDLYHSAVEAFPATTLRQHATHPIVITNLRWVPFVGVKTLFLKAIAQNEGKEYNPIILLKGLKYGEPGVQITASDGREYVFEKIALEHTDVLIRCNCPDFRFRFAYYNHVDSSLFGRKPKKYESKGVRPPANPKELPGMCKHIMVMVKVLNQARIFE